jgi:hypothetical protein
MDINKLIVLGVPAGVMDEEVVVLDAKDLSIEPEVDFVESVNILAYKKGLIGFLDFHG